MNMSVSMCLYLLLFIHVHVVHQLSIFLSFRCFRSEFARHRNQFRIQIRPTKKWDPPSFPNFPVQKPNDEKISELETSASRCVSLLHFFVTFRAWQMFRWALRRKIRCIGPVFVAMSDVLFVSASPRRISVFPVWLASLETLALLEFVKSQST